MPQLAIDRRAKYRFAVREEILSAARALVARDGYESFSMRALADQLGYSPAATYRHFKSKSEIFHQLAEESFAALMSAAERVPSLASEDPVERLRRGMLAYVQFGLQNPDHYRIAFLIHRPPAPRSLKPQPAYAGLKRRVQNCIDAGRFRSGESDLMAQSLWVAAHGITSLLIQRPEFPWVARRRLIAQVIDSAIEGLLVRGH